MELIVEDLRDATVVVGNLLVIQDEEALTARDVSTGETRWEASVGNARLIGGSARNGSVYLTSQDEPERGVVALDARDGSLQWESEAGVTTLAVNGPGDLLGASRNAVVAINPKTGATRWSRAYPTGIRSDVDIAVDQTTVYLTRHCDV